MKNWLAYISGHLGSDVWGLIALDCHQRLRATQPDLGDPSRFIDWLLEELPLDNVDPISFHRVLLCICVQLLGNDFDEIVKKSLRFMERRKSALTRSVVIAMSSHYKDYNKTRVFLEEVEATGTFDIGPLVGRDEEEGNLAAASSGKWKRKRKQERRKRNEYIAFICHASEDKDSVVRPLALSLKAMGFCVWYDEFELKVGDSLRERIDQGIRKSRHGVVVLSKAFFEKEWPKWELDALATRASKETGRILPIWHGVTKEEVKSFSPLLASIFALTTSGQSIEEIARPLAERFREQPISNVTSEAMPDGKQTRTKASPSQEGAFKREKTLKSVPSQKDVWEGHPRTIRVTCPKCRKRYTEKDFDNEDATGDTMTCECGEEWIVG